MTEATRIDGALVRQLDRSVDNIGMMNTIKGTVSCRQCRKDIKTEIHRCVRCDKVFHPSCVKIHKVYNEVNELVPCDGKLEKYSVRGDGEEPNYKERSTAMSAMRVVTEDKIDIVYRMVKEIKNEIVGKEVLKNVITEAIDEEMDRIRKEIQHWKCEELGAMIGEAVKMEINKIMLNIPILNDGKAVRKSYSETAREDKESILIIKPMKNEEVNSSEDTKRDIKKKIDVSKLGVGITKMKKVTRGAVVVGCENKSQAEILKNKVNKELGEKYVIQAPMKKKLKIKIFDVEQEDSENEPELWEKITEQNGFRKGSVHGKILHVAKNGRRNGKNQGMTVIAEVDEETHKNLLGEEKLKIGWNMCRVQNYIGLLRCFKCCGFYHFAKDCKKEVACGKCAGKHATKECESKIKKCINCEEKIKNFKIKNLDSSHSAFDGDCQCYKREWNKLKDKINGSL